MTITINGTGTVTGANTLTNTNTVTSAAATALTLQSAGTTAVTIDTSQNVGIGTTNPSAGKLSIVAAVASTAFYAGSSTQGVYISNSTGNDVVYNSSGNNVGAHVWQTGNTERARIDSSGNLLVGKTTNNDTTIGCVVTPTDGNTGRYKATGDGGAIGASFQVTNTSGTSLCLIRPNGNLQNANNSYGAISDIKLKENIIDATPKLARLMQVKVRNYNLIESDKKQIGVIAQELEQIFPSMVEESPDEDKDGNRLETTTKSVKYSVFVPMLIKAIQEQQALITSLTTRLTALENK